MSKKDFSKTIHIDSVFDTSSILNGLTKIQQQLQATTSVKGRGMLASIELEIDKATKALAQMQSQAQKGFSSTTEVNDFNRQLERTSNNVMEIYRDLKEVAGLTLSDGAKKLGIELDKIAKSVEKINKDFNTSINNTLKESKLPDEIKKGLRALIESKEVSKELYEEQSRQLDKIIAKERASYIIEQDRMKLKAKQESAEKSLGKNTSLFSSGRFEFKDFSLTRKGYNTSLGQAIRATNEKGNIRQTAKIDERSFSSELNKSYVDTLIQVAIQGKKAADAVDALAAAWEGAGLVFNREKLTQFVQEDFNKITFSDKLSDKQVKTLGGMAETIQNYQTNADVIEKTRQMVILNNQETEALKQQADAAKTAAAAQDALGRSADQALSQEKSNIESTTDSWETFKDELNRTAETQIQIDEGFSRIVNRLKYFFSAATIFRSLSNAIRQTYTDVKELDKSFAEIAMVTRYSVNEMWQSYEQYAAMANRLGQSTNDVIKASALFYQQGLDTNEALVLTEDTMKLATLAGIDFAEATDLMTAALRGFKLEMTEGAHITDVYSELAAHAAANVQEIAVAMNKTAAIANSAGMSFENTAAFLTQMIEGTQESAANIGTAMKTVIARFTELKENVDASDSDFDDLDYNKVDTALKSIGIQLKDVNGQFRNLDDIFLELSKRWQTLSRNEQRYIATTAAGSRQQSRFIALMDNYARTIELVEIAQDSQGRSSQQFAKYSDSVEYSVKRLQNTWEQFRVSLADNEFYKGIINLANEVLNKVSQFDGIDWAKSVLIFTTVGKLAGSNFLNGMQQAISSGRNALQQKMTDLTLKKDGLAGAVIGKSLEKNVQKQLSKTSEYQSLNNLVQQRTDLMTKVEKLWDKSEQDLKRFAQLDQEAKAAYMTNNEAEVKRLVAEREAARQESMNSSHNLSVAAREKEQFDEQFDEKFQAQQKALEPKKQEITEQYSKIYTSALSTVGTSAAAAFTSAFTAGMMTDDPSKVFISTLAGGMTAAIPGVINTFSQGLAAKGFGTAIAGALQTGLVSLAVTGAIAGIAWGWKEVKQYIADENEKELRNSSDYYDAIKTIEELKAQEEVLGDVAYKTAQASEKSSQAYQDLADKTDELEELRGKILLTTEESDRLVEVSNEIAKIAPELVDKYDAEGNAVIGLKSSYEELLETKKQLMLQDKESADQAALNLQTAQLEEKLQEKRSKEDFQEQIEKSPVIKNILNDQNLETAFRNKGVSGTLNDFAARSNGNFDEVGTTYGLDLNKSELDQQGSLLKEVFKNISELSALQNKNDEDVLGYLDEFINGKESQERTDLIQKMKDAINAYSVNTAKVNSEINELANTMLQTGLSAANTKLSVSSKTYQNTTDQNVKQLMQGYVLGESNLNWKTWSQQNQNATAEDWKKAIEAANVDIEGFENVFNEAVIALLTEIFSKDLNLREIAKKLENNPEILNIWKEQHKEQIDAYQERLNGILKIYGFNAKVDAFDNFQENHLLFKGHSTQDFKAINLFRDVESDAFISSLQQWSGAGLQEKFANILLKSGLNSKQISQIFNINWSEIAANEYEEQIDALAKILGMKAPELKNIVKDTGLLNFAITNVEEFKNSIDKQVKSLDKYDKTLNAIKTSGESFAKDGKVSAAGIEALYDRGLDVAKLVNDDLSFNYQDARKAIDDILDGEIQTLQVRLNSTKTLHDQLLIANSLTGRITSATLEANGFDANLIAKYFTKDKEGNYSKKDILTTDLNETTKALEEQEQIVKSLTLSVQARRKEADSIFKGFQKELEDVNDKREKAQQAVDKAYKDVLEKQQAVIDKEKELNKVLYGDSAAKNKLDVIYNYTTALDTLKETVDDAKKALDDLQGRDPSPYLNQYISGLRGQKGYLTASNDRYNVAINNIDRVLSDRLTSYLTGLGRGISNNVSDYYSYNSGLDRYVINYGALNAVQMNNDLKDFIEEQVDLMNQYKKNIKTNLNEIENLEKEFRDYQRKVRDNYISVQDNVAKTLKEYYQQQVEDKKDLYDSLEEADNKYLDALEKAIDKQRKLRDKQNAWNDLSTKEKRLSLLQRDTSGANQRTTQSLQKEIQKDREKLLDDSVDSVVNELKEFYELQKETRDLEIEYQENVLENTNYIKEANALLEGWKTVDEMRDWMWEHTKDIDKMSDQAVEKLTEDWATMFDNIKLYNELTQKDIVTIFNVSNQEVQGIILNTSETLTSEADRAFREITEKVDESISNAEKAVQDAMDALADAQNTYNEKLKEFNELIADTSDEIQRIMDIMGQEGSKVEWNDERRTIADLVAERKAEVEDNNNRNFETYSTIKNRVEEQGSTTYSRAKIGGTDEEQLWTYLRAAGYIVAYNTTTGKVFSNQGDFEKFMTSKGRLEYYRRYEDGGLANYTGPAWVDGTPARPEAFLNADDTARIGEAANILASLASLGSNGTLSAGISSVVGDTNSQINIYVNSIATESQVDYLIDRVKEEFVDAANPIGTSVILHK